MSAEVLSARAAAVDPSELAPKISLYDEMAAILGADHPHFLRSKLMLEKLDAEEDPLIVLAELIKGYRDQNRLNEWRNGAKENDAEHSYMLSQYVTALKERFYPDDLELDDFKLKAYAEVHDWIEILVGDTVTLAMPDHEYEAKVSSEAEVVDVFHSFLESKGLVSQAELFDEYENQRNKAARFVKAVDKMMPSIVSLVGDAVGPHVEHGIFTPEQLELAFEIDQIRFEARFGEEFPELVPVLEYYRNKVVEVFRGVVGDRPIKMNGIIGQAALFGTGSYEI